MAFDVQGNISLASASLPLTIDREPVSPPPAITLLPSSDLGLRSNDRLTINKEFESVDEFIQEYITNISRTGVFIKSSSVLPVGTEVRIHFTILMDGIETIEGTGEVVRHESDPPGMGVVFKELSEDSRVLI
ncbi:MAG: hypothetical protein EBS89_10845, partial [Proteobacteria bacterium]|nr:hypothetical protein [Pseudomonadota bacterium]